MKLSDFDFDLPERLIATRPARPRSSARMLVDDRGTISDAQAIDLPRWLRPPCWSRRRMAAGAHWSSR